MSAKNQSGVSDARLPMLEAGLKERTRPISNNFFSFFGVEGDDGDCMTELRECCGGRRPITVHKFQDVPIFLHHNPFVLHGYRSMLPIGLCLKSLFAWSNDTVNTWSHLLGFFVLFAVMVYDNVQDVKIDLLDRFVLTAGLICFQFCMLASAGYHLFRCHSEEANQRWLALDLTGISVGLLGCYLPAIHFGFYCLSVWRDIYMIVIGGLFGAVFIWQAKPNNHSLRWFRIRQVLYVALTAYGVLPAVHWVYLNGGIGSTIVQIFAPKIMGVYLLAGLAFGFYVSQFPERLFPGWFDYVGSSHQCWHVVVVILFVWWHNCGRELLVYRHGNPCHA